GIITAGFGAAVSVVGEAVSTGGAFGVSRVAAVVVGAAVVVAAGGGLGVTVFGAAGGGATSLAGASSDSGSSQSDGTSATSAGRATRAAIGAGSGGTPTGLSWCAGGAEGTGGGVGRCAAFGS